MLPCSEVARLIASEALRQAPIHRRLAVRFHLLLCDHCRRYARELRLLGASVREEFRRLVPDPTQLGTLEASIRDRIRSEGETRNPSPPA